MGTRWPDKDDWVRSNRVPTKTPWKRYNRVFSSFSFFTHGPIATRHRDYRLKRTKNVEIIAIFDFSVEIDKPLHFWPSLIARNIIRYLIFQCKRLLF